MKKSIYTLLILIIGMSSCQDVPSLVNSIAKENIVECKFVGLGGSSSSLYKKFEQLKSNASKEELIKLMNHDSLAVVAYSTYAIVDRKLIAPNKLLERFINQNENVTTFCGCLIDEESISSLIYHRYWSDRVEYPDEYDYEKRIINDSNELKKMDSLILYSKKPYWILLSRALENRVYSHEYNLKIEEWAFAKRDFYALEYVFKNLQKGNEDKLEASLSQYLNNEDIYEVRKEEINQMLLELKKAKANTL